MLTAGALLLTHFETFRSRLPSFESYFNFKNMIYLWIALGVVKVIHEFGHGLSCKAFGGEVHEMGFLLLCFSPAMYCNVSDAWRLPNKWHRILISFAGIWVELMIAAAATFQWWNTVPDTFYNNLCLNLMVVCSVSTVLFNGNPLMRYDGYYVLADWLEIPNLRDRSNRYLQNVAMEYGLGIEVQPEPYMELGRKLLFLTFAIVSYVYRWVVTFVILKVMATFLKPYKLEVISEMLAMGALASMIGWPLYRLIKNVKKRGRLPDMKPIRVAISASLVAAVLFVVFFVPMPVSRIREHGMVQGQPTEIAQVTVEVPGMLKELLVKEGQIVKKGKELARFSSLELEKQRDEALSQKEIKEVTVRALNEKISKELDPALVVSMREQRTKAQSEYNQAKSTLELLKQQAQQLTLRAPRDGVVMGLPAIDEIGKHWDKDQSTFCSIGDKTKLRALVPINTGDYNLLQENYIDKEAKKKPLEATIRVQGHDSRLWQGRISTLPQSDCKNLPKDLSTKWGGTFAVKPTSTQQELVPQSQVFLVGIDFIDPDETIAIGSAAQVKIHNEHRSCAWWIWRTINNSFDLAHANFLN